MTQSCCNGAGAESFSSSEDRLIVGDKVQTAEAYLTGGVAYAKGDVLVLNATTNVASLAVDGTLANAQYIMPFTLTAGEATAHAATGLHLQFYCQGEFDESLVKVGGVALTAPQILVAKAAFAKTAIQLRKVL